MSLAPIISEQVSSAAQIYDFTTIAGSAGNWGSTDGTNRAAQFSDPIGIAVDTNGNVYVADYDNHTIRKVTPVGTNWVTTTIAGTASLHGSTNGTNSEALFYNPAGVAVDTNGNVYVADTGNATIRKVTPVGPNWVTTTIAGTVLLHGSTDGTNSEALFFWPWAVALDANGNLYVADTWYYTIRKVTPVGTNWVTTTIAGLAGNTPGSADGTNSNARFYQPDGVAVDTNGNVYVADTGNDTIRKITPVGTNWVTTTIAGTVTNIGSADGTNGDAQFNYPYGVAVDTNGNVYVADTGNSTIRKVTPVGTNLSAVVDWVTTTIGGLALNDGSADGINGAAQFNYPKGVAVDRGGNLYVADTDNATIRLGVPFLGTPMITSQPQSLTVTNGNPAAFSVTASGIAPLIYQWQKDGTNLVNGGNVSGATTNTLTLSTTTTNDDGNYTVIITNTYGSVTSSVATLTVLSVPWGTLTITKETAKLNFAKTNSDSCTLTATLNLSASYNLTNKPVSLDIGGADVSFTLDTKGKGRGVGTYGSYKLSHKKKAASWTFTAALKTGSWASQWETYGLSNATTTVKAGVPVTLPVTLFIGDEGFYGEKALLYKAKAGKSGTAK
ncbi:MAG: immunoglobulin domain-containing protein [Verrucomicrobiia bacterium]